MSRKIVVISETNDELYKGFTPLVTWCWNQLGWEVICLKGEDIINSDPKGYEGLSPAIVSQCARLYACLLPSVNKVDYLITSDADMFPLPDFNKYFKYDNNEIVSFGRDLTDYHYPICYIGMNYSNWRDVMQLNGETFNSALQRDLRSFKNWWCTDQDIVTERLLKEDVRIIKRGVGGNGMALGRLDRYNMIKPSECSIDFHSLRPFKNYKDTICRIISEYYHADINLIKSICTY